MQPYESQKGSQMVEIRELNNTISLIAKTMVELLDRSFFSVIFRPPSAVDMRRVQLELLQDLSAAGIDPKLFDRMLSSELDRKLKREFGVAFLVVTVGFSLASYAVIILNSTHSWGISQIAITALIIETPIQFIGLLYIIARNLFPQASSHQGFDILHGGLEKRGTTQRKRKVQQTESHREAD
jgi:hypothetical protein